jgi:3-hydroxy acid dehydrogenase/malonic semialdehyde reductase
MEQNRPVIFISGATSGFGQATAALFASHQWDVIITGRRAERLEELKQKLESEHGISAWPLCFDVRSEAAVQQAIDSIPAAWTERLHILVNNAGLAVGRSPIDVGLTEDWDRMIDTNVKGLLYVSKAIIPFLKARKSGHIFNLGSIAGKEVYAGGNVYCASKHAVDALSQAMRIDLVQYAIKVTNIAPGAADTEFSLVRFKGDQSQADTTYLGFDPLVAEDIAETIYFAATRPKHVTINDLVIMPTAQASATIFHKTTL